MEDTDAQLQLKKRARRRLVGAVAFAVLAAVVLPMVMDQEPKQSVQDVEIRIPGQDEKPFTPKLAAAAPPSEVAKPAPAVVAPAPTPAPVPAPAVAKPAEPVEAKPQPVPTTRVVDTTKSSDKSADKSAEKAPEKAPEKAKPPTKEKTSEKPQEKPAVKTPDKTTDKDKEKAKAADKAKASDSDAQRAAAILSGKAPEASKAEGSATAGSFVILIGAFANDGNVKTLKGKLGEQGIKVYTEPLDTPQGKKTRVRAGPFPSREAAEKALEKMKRIGVSGVLTGK